MTPFELATLEAGRRIEVLPAEVASWVRASRANIGGMGIHHSQLLALTVLMDILVHRQRDLLAARPVPAATPAYANAELEFTAELVGAHELWAAFRAVFEQRADERLAARLHAADLVAASAYRKAIDRAIAWDVVTPNECREPPLVYAEALDSPGTAARGGNVTGLAGTIRRYRDRLLPIPIVLFPEDRLDQTWSLSALVHEVGHDLDADLSFSGDAIGAGIDALRDRRVAADRRDVWASWGAEVVADACGIVLGGAGFAADLCTWLMPIALAGLYDQPSADRHPPPAVRMRALSAMVAATGVESWRGLAGDIGAAAEALAMPAWQRPYWGDAAIFARALLTTPLPALANHPIVELVPDLAAEADAVDRLAAYLRGGEDEQASAEPPLVPARLVPSAAAMALRMNPAAEDLDGIATRALDRIAESRIGDAPQPRALQGSFGDPGAEDRRRYRRDLAGQLVVRVTGGIAPLVAGRR